MGPHRTLMSLPRSTPSSLPPHPAPGTLLSGAELLVCALEAEGVEVIFGHPGGAVIKIYDALATLNPSFQHVLVRHEQGGTHAAEGYAKATGRVGTVLVTSGPGATNCVTGIADAYMDSIPLVVFTGQVPVPAIGNDAFQETDTIGVTRSITKHSFQVRRVEDLTWMVRAAYTIARTGRPGPVVVDLPKDVLLDQAPFVIPDDTAIRARIRGYQPEVSIDPDKIAQAAAMLRQAERPLLYVGGGTLSGHADAELKQLAHTTGIPVTTTLHGLGAFPEDDPLSLGMLGMHGTWYANMAVQHCDLLIAVGARFDDRVTGKLEAWAPHAKVIHFDIDQACISKNVWCDCAIRGHVKDALAALLPHTEPLALTPWREQLAAWREQAPLTVEDDDQLRAQTVIRLLRDQTQGDAVVITDVGQHQMWTAQYFQYVHPRSHITSGGLGTMGFSLPAAMGAAFGLRAQGVDRPVLSISGDGGFVMNAQELGVIAKHRLPVKIVVINNQYLGMVRQWQELFHDERYSHTDLADTNPDFGKLAEAFGIPAYYAETPTEAQEAIDAAWTHTDGPVLIEFRVLKEDMVFPMVPAGAATEDMITARFED